MNPVISAYITETDDGLRLIIRCNGFMLGVITTSDPISVNRTSKGFDIDTLVADSKKFMTGVVFVDEAFIEGEPVTASYKCVSKRCLQ